MTFFLNLNQVPNAVSMVTKLLRSASYEVMLCNMASDVHNVDKMLVAVRRVCSQIDVWVDLSCVCCTGNACTSLSV